MKQKTKQRTALLAILFILLFPVVFTKADSNQTQNTGFASPTWQNATPANNTGVAYSPGYQHTFSVTWTGEENVSITHNFTGTQKTQLLESTNNTYTYKTELPAGTYAWKMKAENNSSVNKTPYFTYKVEKAQPTITLLLNNETGNITITQNDYVNITGFLEKGESNLTLEILGEEYTGKNITLSLQFTEPGTYNATLSHNATQNYTHSEITRTIFVEEKTEGEYNLLAPNTEFSLGDIMEYLINAPSPSDVTIKISKKTKFGDTYWLELLETINLENKTFPALFTNTNTKKAGEYVIEAEFPDTGKTLQAEYEVINTLSVEIKGSTSIKTNTKTNLEATASKGISPYQYTWTLSNGTKINNRKLEVTYKDLGTYNTKLEVKDAEENKFEKTMTLDVREYYDLTVEVRNQDNQALEDARVLITDTNEEKWTDSNGKTTFNLPSNEYRVRASISGYISKNVDVDLDKDKAITITLEKQESAASAGSSKIQLESPANNAEVSEEVEFKATLSTRLQSTCKLFITEKDSQWFLQVAEKQSTGSGTLTFNEKLDEGSYKWKVECFADNKNHESQIREFTVSMSDRAAATAFDESVIDAGTLRQKLDDATDSINSLGLNERKAAEALGFHEKIRVAMRDYERILRDINSMQFRRDLTNAQRQEKLLEYREAIREIESTTPLSMELFGFEEFINHPGSEDLKVIAEEYRDERNIQGRLSTRELEELQNKIRVRTIAGQVSITFISGEEKDVTFIHKMVEYTGETNSNHFLLEKIPGAFSGEIIILSDHTIVKRNELIRLERAQNITYYSVGKTSLEEAKSAYTLLLSEAVFSSARPTNPLTGNITLSNINMDSTAWLVALLIVIVFAYLAYSFDLIEKAKSLTKMLSSEKRLKELILLINDSKDYLETGNIERAILIYKEIKILYEKAPLPVKNKVYEEATSLTKLIDEKYVASLIIEINNYVKDGEKPKAITLYNKAVDAYNGLSADAQKSFSDQIKLLGSQLKNG